MTESEPLRTAVQTQADARVRGDDPLFASYMTPKALLQLGAADLPAATVRRGRVLSINEGTSTGLSDVEYQGSWRYVIRTHWERLDGHWKATEAELVAGSIRPAWWRKLIRRTNPSRRPTAPRRDLR